MFPVNFCKLYIPFIEFSFYTITTYLQIFKLSNIIYLFFRINDIIICFQSIFYPLYEKWLSLFEHVRPFLKWSLRFSYTAFSLATFALRSLVRRFLAHP